MRACNFLRRSTSPRTLTLYYTGGIMTLPPRTAKTYEQKLRRLREKKLDAHLGNKFYRDL